MAERDGGSNRVGVSRRGFLRSATFAALAVPAGGALAGCGPRAPREPEWRNRQAGMAYRRLGRTGMMISEVVCGGDPIRSPNYRHVSLALEMGLNYLDMAPNYGKGDAELAYGRLLKETGARDRVFLATKISDYRLLRNTLYQDVFQGLPSEKKRAVIERARELRLQRGIDRPDYAVSYYPGQTGDFDYAYLSVAMMRHYRHLVEGSSKFRQFLTRSVEDSLRRVGTDHFDVVLCPHGADAPEELANEEMHETLERLRWQGKLRYVGFSSHNDPAGNLSAAAASGKYDMGMVAYNIVVGGYVEGAIRAAAANGMGVIAMKVAHAVATHHRALQPIPQWRIDKINRIVPGEMKPPLKAYLWALQNPNISAVNSNLWDETYVRENLGVAGKRVELRVG
ncbi:MAG TPA: aldo/keto reductase [Verrucomicrobiae bacterium]|nr:aldo/keto reductase [Verrucomicrobiae bacterium]